MIVPRMSPSDFIITDFFCQDLCLFTPDPHPNTGCCIEAVIHIRKDLYVEYCWYPKTIINKQGEIVPSQIIYTINGYDWRDYDAEKRNK